MRFGCQIFLAYLGVVDVFEAYKIYHPNCGRLMTRRQGKWVCQLLTSQHVHDGHVRSVTIRLIIGNTSFLSSWWQRNEYNLTYFPQPSWFNPDAFPVKPTKSMGKSIIQVTKVNVPNMTIISRKKRRNM